MARTRIADGRARGEIIKGTHDVEVKARPAGDLPNLSRICCDAMCPRPSELLRRGLFRSACVRLRDAREHLVHALRERFGLFDDELGPDAEEKRRETGLAAERSVPNDFVS